MTRTKARSQPKPNEQKASCSQTWSQIVRQALTKLGGIAALRTLYGVIERHPRTAQCAHWKAKVRQVLECSNAYVRVDKGVWGMREKFTASETERLEDLRRARYPRRVRVDR